MIGNLVVSTPSSSYFTRRETAFVGAIAEDVDHLAADLIISHLLGRHETGPGEVGFVAQRAIELGRMADRLVNG